MVSHRLKPPVTSLKTFPRIVRRMRQRGGRKWPMDNVQKTILIVDDEPDIVMAIETILEEAGYAVMSATQSESMMRHLRQGRLPDLILLDMVLAGQRGTEIAGALKRHQETRHIPILMLSAHPDAEQEARSAGVNGFIPKPFDLDDLLATVATFL